MRKRFKMAIVRRCLEKLIENNAGKIIRYCSRCGNKTLWKKEEHQWQPFVKPVESIRCSICLSSVDEIIEKPER
jgi:hypothetical protein